MKGTKITAVARNIKPLMKMPHNRVFSLSLDVTKPENIELMLDEAVRMLGGIDCVLTCAGFGYYERFNDKGYGHIERIFQTNVFSTLYTLERFLAKTDGKVTFVAISSVLGKFGLPGMALYSASKHALDGFQDSYRFEKPNRLHYMTAYPIGLRTNFWERIATDIPLPRPLQSADTAAVAILKGIKAEKRVVYTSISSRIALCVNQAIPVLVLLYQCINKRRYDKWVKNQGKEKPLIKRSFPKTLC
jgi:short-subunit dehydrogenase